MAFAILLLMSLIQSALLNPVSESGNNWFKGSRKFTSTVIAFGFSHSI